MNDINPNKMDWSNIKCSAKNCDVAYDFCEKHLIEFHHHLMKTRIPVCDDCNHSVLVHPALGVVHAKFYPKEQKIEYSAKCLAKDCQCTEGK